MVGIVAMFCVLNVGAAGCVTAGFVFLLLTAACAQSRAAAVDFAALLQGPSESEVAATRQHIRQRPRVVTGVRVTSASQRIGTTQYKVRFVEHRLNGTKHCGLVLIPEGAGKRNLPALVDVPDVRWDYPPRDISRGLYSARILADRAGDFAMILPCLRGGTITLGDTSLHADGDRRDAFDGAAEDVIAFTRAALMIAPEIDSARIAIYGYSRGGGVALLAASRSKLFRAVLAFAAPTDFFRSMNRPGENWAERLAEADRTEHMEPSTREVQQLDFFLRGREHLPLAELRRRVMASSALYFASDLPPARVFHGQKDQPVPVANAIALRAALANADAVTIYEDAGHSLDETSATSEAR
jgi:dipeptidyl aminopeptidase/acylaminoacyl peptidase